MRLRRHDDLVTRTSPQIEVRQMKARRAGTDAGGKAAADVALKVVLELVSDRPVHQLRAHEHFHDGSALGFVEHRLTEGELPAATHTNLH